MLFVTLCFCSCAKNDGVGGEDISIDYDYLDEYDTGEIAQNQLSFIVPLKGKITSEFGDRIHPITGKQSFHTGIDIGVKEGTRVATVAGGIVQEAGQNTAYGNYVLVKHEEGIATFYGHCKEILVQVGTVVRQGETIALSGNTGQYSTGPHLHFGVSINGEYVQPRDYIKVVDNAI